MIARLIRAVAEGLDALADALDRPERAELRLDRVADKQDELCRRVAETEVEIAGLHTAIEVEREGRRTSVAALHNTATESRDRIAKLEDGLNAVHGRINGRLDD